MRTGSQVLSDLLVRIRCFKGGNIDMLAIFVIAQDRGSLLDLVIIGRPHLGLVSRAIPL